MSNDSGNVSVHRALSLFDVFLATLTFSQLRELWQFVNREVDKVALVQEADYQTRLSQACQAAWDNFLTKCSPEEVPAYRSLWEFQPDDNRRETVPERLERVLGFEYLNELIQPGVSRAYQGAVGEAAQAAAREISTKFPPDVWQGFVSGGPVTLTVLGNLDSHLNEAWEARRNAGIDAIRDSSLINAVAESVRAGNAETGAKRIVFFAGCLHLASIARADLAGMDPYGYLPDGPSGEIRNLATLLNFTLPTLALLVREDKIVSYRGELPKGVVVQKGKTTLADFQAQLDRRVN
jgi:hypothetical protein